jgi:phytoene synthase
MRSAEVDDVVDEVPDQHVAQAKLAWWRTEVAQAFAGQASHPAMKALLPHARQFDIRSEHLHAVIDGCQMDLEQTRYLDYAGLQRYCHLVAGIVGEVAASIFGRTDAMTVQYAPPSVLLSSSRTSLETSATTPAADGSTCRSASLQFDVKAHEILNRGYSDRFAALMKFQADRAHRTYDEALALLPEADRAAQKPGLMMANIYRTLLREIESTNFQVLHQRISLTPLRKLWIAWRTQWRGR